MKKPIQDSASVHRPYRLRHVKYCFGQVSDGTLLQWKNRGLIRTGEADHGSRTYLTFSLAELIHVGIVVEMSRYGITKEAMNTSYEIPVTTRKGYFVNVAKPIYKPDNLIKLYEDTAYQISLVFVAETELIQQDSKRNKREVIFYIGRPFSPGGSLSYIATYRVQEQDSFVVINISSLASRAVGMLDDVKNLDDMPLTLDPGRLDEAWAALLFYG